MTGVFQMRDPHEAYYDNISPIPPNYSLACDKFSNVPKTGLTIVYMKRHASSNLPFLRDSIPLRSPSSFLPTKMASVQTLFWSGAEATTFSHDPVSQSCTAIEERCPHQEDDEEARK